MDKKTFTSRWEQAIVLAKDYPPQMQDLVIVDFVQQFIENQVAMIVLDMLYENGTFKPLTENEKVIEKCGLTYEGTFRDFFWRKDYYEGRQVFSILRDEYENTFS